MNLREEMMANPNALQDKMMAALNAGDTPKVSKSYAKQMKAKALKEALAKKKLEGPAKVLPMKKPEAKAASKTAKKVSKAPVKKAAASKKIVQKTMKAGKKKSKR
jgi:hypothetical protein